jgi:hypothetical protein
MDSTRAAHYKRRWATPTRPPPQAPARDPVRLPLGTSPAGGCQRHRGGDARPRTTEVQRRCGPLTWVTDSRGQACSRQPRRRRRHHTLSRWPRAGRSRNRTSGRSVTRQQHPSSSGRHLPVDRSSRSRTHDTSLTCGERRNAFDRRLRAAESDFERSAPGRGPVTRSSLAATLRSGWRRAPPSAPQGAHPAMG